MLSTVNKVVRYIVVTIFIALVVRTLMFILGIDKKLDGKNKTWDSYRDKETKVMNKTGTVLRKVGKELKMIADKAKEKVEQVQKTDKVKETKEKRVTSLKDIANICRKLSDDGSVTIVGSK